MSVSLREQRLQLPASWLETEADGVLVHPVDTGKHAAHESEHQGHGESRPPAARPLLPRALAEERQDRKGERQQIPPEHITEQSDLMLNLRQGALHAPAKRFARLGRSSFVTHPVC